MDRPIFPYSHNSADLEVDSDQGLPVPLAPPTRMPPPPPVAAAPLAFPGASASAGSELGGDLSYSSYSGGQSGVSVSSSPLSSSLSSPPPPPAQHFEQPQSQSPRDSLLNILARSALSALLALRTALTTRRVWAIHRQYGLIVFIATTLVFVALHASAIPIHILLAVVSFVSMGKIKFSASAIHSVIWGVCSFLPVLMLVFLRYCYTEPLNQLMLATLDVLDPSLAARLRATPIPKFSHDLKALLMRYLRYFFLAIIGLCLSYIPVVGPLSVALLQFLTVAPIVGKKPALYLCAASFLPGFKRLGLGALNVVLWSKALAKELMYVYDERIRVERASGRLPPANLGRFTKSEQYALTVGFCIPFAIVIYGTSYGWLVFGLAQASMSVLIVEIEKREREQFQAR